MTDSNIFLAEDPTSVDALVHDAVLRLSWKIPQPCSTNTQIGFAMRKGRLTAELRKYCRLYEEWSLKIPSLDHLFAAGSYIYQKIPQSFSTNDPLLTSEENFEEIWSVATRRISDLPKAARLEHDPFERKPRRKRRTSSRTQLKGVDPPELDVCLGESTSRELEDLIWFHGSAGSVMQRAIRRLWEQTALRSRPGQNGGQEWHDDPVEAWAEIRRQSAALKAQMARKD